MIRQQLTDMKEGLFNNKSLHACTFMPSRIVHPKIDGLSFVGYYNCRSKESDLSNLGTREQQGKYQIYWGFRIPEGRKK
jgi:hypothetical protein